MSASATKASPNESDEGRYRSFLRWAGSKRQLFPAIAKYWRSEFHRYVEPFCGSASLFFELRPARAALSDINSELVEALRAVQLWPDTVSECIGRFSVSKAEYYRVRALCPDDLAPAMRAARFIYLNLLCFNGLYRVNKLGRFNVPYGSKQRKTLVSQLQMRQVSRALAEVELVTRDFEESVNSTQAGDFLYLDPPYATTSRRVFTEYSKNAFSEQDLGRLRESLAEADKRGVKFVLSYADSPEMHELASGWRIERVVARRNIAGFVGARKVVDEVLVSN